MSEAHKIASSTIATHGTDGPFGKVTLREPSRSDGSSNRSESFEPASYPPHESARDNAATLLVLGASRGRAPSAGTSRGQVSLASVSRKTILGLMR